MRKMELTVREKVLIVLGVLWLIVLIVIAVSYYVLE